MKKENKRKSVKIEEKDHVLRIAVTVVIALLIVGAIIVVVRLMNPKADTEAGIQRLHQMEKTDVSEVDRQIQELEKAEQEAAEPDTNPEFPDTVNSETAAKKCAEEKAKNLQRSIVMQLCEAKEKGFSLN